MIGALSAAGFLFLVPILAGASGQLQEAGAPQSQAQSAPPAAPQTPPPNSTKPKPKKVWTNDNLSNSGAGISVVGSDKPASKSDANRKSDADNSVDPMTLRALREQLQKLEAQRAVIDQQLSNLKGLRKGEVKNAGGLNTNTWTYNSSSIEEQIQQLQAKKSKVQGMIDELLDGARAHGIEPGQLR